MTGSELAEWMPGVKVAVFDFKLSSQMIWSTQGKKKKSANKDAGYYYC